MVLAPLDRARDNEVGTARRSGPRGRNLERGLDPERGDADRRARQLLPPQMGRQAIADILREAAEDPEIARNAPYGTPVRRLDEAGAAKRPVIRQPL